MLEKINLNNKMEKLIIFTKRKTNKKINLGTRNPYYTFSSTL